MIYVGIFLLNAVIDAVWTRYIQAVGAKKAHAAAMWSVSLVLLGALNVIAYIDNHWLLLPAIMGGYLGAYVAVRKS